MSYQITEVRRLTKVTHPDSGTTSIAHNTDGSMRWKTDQKVKHARYDGFGNLWTQAVTKGTAPAVSLSLDMAKNRVNSVSWSYDNNGNTTSMTMLCGGWATMTYDIDNRLMSWTGAPGTEEYRYLADNKRVWKKSPSGAETIYFYGVGGQKLATYTVNPSPFSLTGLQDNMYFGGKLIRADGVSVVHDRLGSVVYRHGTGAKDYFPYGDEIGTATAGNVDKFGTYLRDQTTGFDYADQRYFGGLQGRFLTADPYEASGAASAPGSWNRYPFVGGDPVNFNDRSGLNAAPVIDGCDECGGDGFPEGLDTDPLDATSGGDGENGVGNPGGNTKAWAKVLKKIAKATNRALKQLANPSDGCQKALKAFGATAEKLSATLIGTSYSEITTNYVPLSALYSNSAVAGAASGLTTSVRQQYYSQDAAGKHINALSYLNSANSFHGAMVSIDGNVVNRAAPGVVALVLTHEAVHTSTNLIDDNFKSIIEGLDPAFSATVNEGAGKNLMDEFLKEKCFK